MKQGVFYFLGFVAEILKSISLWHMTKNRLEAFSDGVIAIIITIMVLELKVPHGASFSDLTPLAAKFVSYVLSFLYVGIYWNNHHHLLHTVKTVNGGILWANMFLLFCLSLIPFSTGWMGENHFAALPMALYGVTLFLCGLAYSILTQVIIGAHGGKKSVLSKAIGNDFKGKISVVVYAIAILLSFQNEWIAFALYCSVALMWLIPDSRIERTLSNE